VGDAEGRSVSDQLAGSANIRGRPMFMGRACLQFGGLVYVMRDPWESGGIILDITFEPESMEEFKRVFYEELGVC